MTRTAAALAAPLLLLALAGCGDTIASEPPKPTFTTPRLVDVLADNPMPLDELETPAPLTTEPPAGPLDLFANGTYVVGTDIVPGTYRAPGPSYEGGSCYWSRLKDTTGEFDAIITNGSSEGPVTVTIKDTDGAFQSSGCVGWTKVD